MSKKENILFSIVTVCYNSKKTISKTFNSVLLQNCTDYEYIVIDGGSNDGTVDIIRDYEPLFLGRMKWVSESDKGIYDAFNKGIKQCNGAFIWLVNSDDWIEKNALEEIKQIAKQYQGTLTVLCGQYNYWKYTKQIYMNTVMTKESLYKAYVNLYMGIFHPACLFSNKVYKEVGLYNDKYNISGDLDHFLRCHEKGANFVPVDKVIINMTHGGISTKLLLKKHLSDWRLLYSKYTKNKFFYYYQIVKKTIKWVLFRKY